MIKFSALIFLISTYLLYQILIHGVFGLYRLPQWHSVKSFYQNGLMTAQEFRNERQTMAGDQLDLSAWNGFNEVIWDQPLAWTELKVKFKLSQNSYLWIFTNQTINKKFGFRFSLDKNHPSGYYTLDENELINQRFSLKFDQQPDQPIELKLALDQQRSIVFINNKKIAELEFDLRNNQLLSFKSSFRPVYLLKVRVGNSEASTIENFTPPFILSYLILALSIVSLFWVAARFVFARKPQVQFYLLLTDILFLSFIGIFFFLDYHFISKRYFYKNVVDFQRIHVFESELPFETFRKKIFHFLAIMTGDHEAEFVTAENNLMYHFYKPFHFESQSKKIQSLYESNGLDQNTLPMRYQLIDSKNQLHLLTNFDDLLSNSKANDFRMLFIGTSQIWGGGAKSLQTSFASLLTKQFNSTYTSKRFWSLNLSEPGTDSTLQLEKLDLFVPMWNPKLIIVDLGNNDSDVILFRNNLQKMVEIAKGQNSKIIFLKEANSLEYENPFLLNKHQVIDEISATNQLQVLDLHTTMQEFEKNDTGIIWWDVVHFSQGGHQLAANWLFEQLRPYFENKK